MDSKSLGELTLQWVKRRYVGEELSNKQLKLLEKATSADIYAEAIVTYEPYDKQGYPQIEVNCTVSIGKDTFTLPPLGQDSFLSISEIFEQIIKEK